MPDTEPTAIRKLKHQIKNTHAGKIQNVAAFKVEGYNYIACNKIIFQLNRV
jgi:hypothetical protein